MTDREFIVFVMVSVVILFIIFGVIGVLINLIKPNPESGKLSNKSNCRYFITDISGNRREVTQEEFEREERGFGYTVFIFFVIFMLLFV